MKPIFQRIIDWYLTHGNDESIYRQFRKDICDPRDWQQSVFHIGRAAVGDDRIYKLADQLDWRIADDYYVADNQALAQMFASVNPDKLHHTIKRLDTIIDKPATTTWDPAEDYFGSRQHWSWCDAMFMAPPLWYHVSRQTGDERYARFARAEIGQMIELLYDSTARLFARDIRFIGKPFWARGNGWVLAGLARTKAVEYAPLWREVAYALRTRQRSDGGWSSALDDHGPAECSATALIAYGLEAGVRLGWGDQADRSAALRAWKLVSDTMIEDTGKILWVQPIGEKVDQVERNDTSYFGAGIVLLAGSLFYTG